MWQKIKNVYHLGLAMLANTVYGFPGKSLFIIGVTGTDGKTTTASLIYHILKSSGKDVSLISTIGAFIDGKTYDVGFHVTNPSSFPLQKFLKLIKNSSNSKEKYVVLEVTSHGIDQNRIWGIPFEIAILTNITHEHLDYHKTYENYLRTKTLLLQKANTAIVNKDDGSYSSVYKLLKNKVVTYGLNNAEISSKDLVSKSLDGFHKYNELAAISVCKTIGVSIGDIKKGISTFVRPKGRMETVYKNDFEVMIDFAHTPNAFKNLLSLIRSTVKGKIIHVFGSAGLRDKTKRPLMGKFASMYDDIIILTSEDPRSEDPKEIIDNISSGFINSRKFEVIKIYDRKKAIEKAIEIAQKNDLVVITGKAHEKSMNYGKGEEDWDEFKAVEEALER